MTGNPIILLLNLKKNKMDILKKDFEAIEQLLNNNEKLALRKMVDIFPEIANSYHHDIFDSIIMYVLSKGDNDLKKYIQSKLKHEKDKYLLGIYKEWIEAIDKNEDKYS